MTQNRQRTVWVVRHWRLPGQSKELTIDLTKVDADNLKGTMYTFDASAKWIR